MNFIFLFLSKVKENTFLKSVLLLASSTALAQMVTVLVTPVLTRFFTPEDFGVLSAYTSLLVILLSVGSFRYEFSLPLVRQNRAADCLFVLCLILLLLSSIVSLLFVIVFSYFELFQIEGYLFWLLPLGILGGGTFQVVNYWMVRQKTFRNLAKANVSRSVVQGLTQLGLGAYGVGALALMLGYAIAPGVAVFRVICKSISGFRGCSRRRIYVLAVRFKRFPIYAMPASALNVGAVHITPFLVIHYFGLASAGYFLLVQRVMGAPMAFLGMSISNVYLSELPRLKESNQNLMLKLYIKSCRNLLIVGLPVVTIAISFLYFGIDVVFGSTWSGASDIVLYMSPFFLAQFVFAPLSQTLNVLDRQELQLVLDAIRLVLPNSLMCLFAVSGAEIEITLGFYSVAMLVTYLISFVLTIFAISKFSDSSLSRTQSDAL